MGTQKERISLSAARWLRLEIDLLLLCHRRCRRVAVLGPQFRFSEVVQKQWLPMKWPVEFDDTPWEFAMLQVPCFWTVTFEEWLDQVLCLIKILANRPKWLVHVSSCKR